jgi:hypothetical protein
MALDSENGFGLSDEKTMAYDTDRTIAVLTTAIAVCRGMLYSARTGDASQREIEAILDSTSYETLTKLIGEEATRHAMHLSETISRDDRDVLLAIGDTSYDSPDRIKPNPAKLKLIIECLLSATFSEDEEKWLFAAGNAVCPDPAWSDYVYWPDRHGLDGSVDAAVEKAMAYQPIILPDAT